MGEGDQQPAFRTMIPFRTLLTRIGLPNSLIWFMILHAYSASSSVMNSQNPKPWCDWETRSLGRWTLARSRRGRHQCRIGRAKGCAMRRTDGTGLAVWGGSQSVPVDPQHRPDRYPQHELPHQGVRTPLIEITLGRGSARPVVPASPDVSRDTRSPPDSGPCPAVARPC